MSNVDLSLFVPKRYWVLARTFLGFWPFALTFNVILDRFWLKESLKTLRNALKRSWNIHAKSPTLDGKKSWQYDHDSFTFKNWKINCNDYNHYSINEFKLKLMSENRIIEIAIYAISTNACRSTNFPKQ